MITLAIDTSTRSCSVGIQSEDTLLGELFINNQLTHSATLLDAVSQVLRLGGVAFCDISRIVVTVGPGSYTGLRIGICFVKGLALPDSIVCVGVSTLKALACSLAYCDKKILSILDARAGRVYAALFESRDGRVSRLTPDLACTLESLEQYISPGTIAVGDGAPAAHARFSHLGLSAAGPEHLFLHASSVISAAKGLNGRSAHDLKPNYLRPSQAERMLSDKRRG